MDCPVCGQEVKMVSGHGNYYKNNEPFYYFCQGDGLKKMGHFVIFTPDMTSPVIVLNYHTLKDVDF